MVGKTEDSGLAGLKMITRILPRLLGSCAIVFAIGASAFVYLTLDAQPHQMANNYPIRLILPSLAETKYPIRLILPSIVETKYPIRLILPSPTEEDTPAFQPFAPADRELANGAASVLDTAAIVSPQSSPKGQLSVDRSRSSPDFLMKLEFDLSKLGVRSLDSPGGGAVTVMKSVSLDGTYGGDVRIFVFGDSSLAIDRSELSRLLVAAGKPVLQSAEGSPSNDAENVITFDDVRRQGIGIRYDPVGDRILVST